MDDDPDQLSRVFAALADPTRRDLVARLTVGDASVGELAAPYEISLQAISKHVKVLEEAGEVWIAAEYESDDRLAEEVSQLLYRIQVIMLGRGLTLDDVYKYL